jgi:DNA-directed RNA polymerase specialized sigma24 family protein
MHKQTALTQESFDQLLAWLDSDRERAGEKYEHIRRCLIKIFTCRSCQDAEALADTTINRVTLKVPQIIKEYVGDPALYFYGVAQKVFLESLREPRPVVAPTPAAAPTEETEREFECLERCMERLTANNRSLVLEYYQNEKRAKIDHRKEMAERFGIAPNALRIRAHRIRVSLQRCMQECMDQGLTA